MTRVTNDVYCTSCGERIKQEAELCPYCGVRQSSNRPSPTESIAQEEYCTSCGEKVKTAAEICPHCGVRRHETPPATDDKGTAYYLGWGFGILFILGAFSTLGDGPGIIIPFLQALALLAIGLFLVPPVRQRVRERKHSLTTFGRVQSVDERAIGSVDATCTACYGSISEGVERRYSEGLVAFGVVLRTLESGANTYCRACANGQSVEQERLLETE